MGVLALLLNADLNFSPGVRQLRSSIPSRGRRRGHCSSHVHSFFPASTGGRLLKESDTSPYTPKPTPASRLTRGTDPTVRPEEALEWAEAGGALWAQHRGRKTVLITDID